MKRIIILLLISVLAACASGGARAPVAERGSIVGKGSMHSAQRESDWRPELHIVQRGETVYGIAFNYGLDYRELADLNGIRSPYLISVGQRLRLFPAGTRTVTTTTAVAPPAVVESRPIDNLLKEQPKVVKYAYNDAAMAQIEKVQQEPQKTVAASAKPEPAAKPAAAPEPIRVAAGDDEALDWAMPADGNLIAGYSEAANRKGIDIGGKLGQPVKASAPGKVVYSGSGLRGYGKLVIIKHNNTYLSAYAHNDKILVKEGQSVSRGQKIAEMGNSDADRIKLHFEVRRFGKPVDPSKYLPLGKS